MLDFQGVYMRYVGLAEWRRKWKLLCHLGFGVAYNPKCLQSSRLYLIITNNRIKL